MSATVLREAAALMRELADKAAAQPLVNVRVQSVWLGSRFYLASTPEREYALADWLDAEADEIPPGATHYRDGLLEDAPAVRLARAYLTP